MRPYGLATARLGLDEVFKNCIEVRGCYTRGSGLLAALSKLRYVECSILRDVTVERLLPMQERLREIGFLVEIDVRKSSRSYNRIEPTSMCSCIVK